MDSGLSIFDPVNMQEGRDLSYSALMAEASDVCEPEHVNAEDPLFMQNEWINPPIDEQFPPKAEAPSEAATVPAEDDGLYHTADLAPGHKGFQTLENRDLASALEGAIILSRAQKSAEPIRQVAEDIKLLVNQTAVLNS